MDSVIEYKSPWGRALYIMSSVSVIIVLGIPLIILIIRRNDLPFFNIIFFLLPLMLLIAALFTIRGYILTPDTLFIKRLLWKTRIDLSDLVSVEVDPQAMDKSIRTFGNGGMFSFSGYYRNKKLGSYRAFVTNPQLSIILKFSNRTILITPNNPVDFTNTIKQYRSID